MMSSFKDFYKEEIEYKIYVDLDSTLCDFLAAFNKISPDETYKEMKKDNRESDAWELIHKAGKEYWSEMPWMKDGKDLWNFIKEYNPIVLSSPGTHKTDNIIDGKKEWVKVELGEKVPAIIEKLKYKYAAPNHILIDDDKRNIDMWEEKGGIAILHKSAEDTIKQIQDLIK